MLSESPQFYLFISVIVFSLGVIGVILRRNPLVMFMSIELMLNASNLAFLTFSRFVTGGEALIQQGWVFVFLVMIVAAAEAVVGLGIIITVFRSRKQVDVDTMYALKG